MEKSTVQHVHSRGGRYSRLQSIEVRSDGLYLCLSSLSSPSTNSPRVSLVHLLYYHGNTDDDLIKHVLRTYVPFVSSIVDNAKRPRIPSRVSYPMPRSGVTRRSVCQLRDDVMSLWFEFTLKQFFSDARSVRKRLEFHLSRLDIICNKGKHARITRRNPRYLSHRAVSSIQHYLPHHLISQLIISPPEFKPSQNHSPLEKIPSNRTPSLKNPSFTHTHP
jgi:hypothetical protein